MWSGVENQGQSTHFFQTVQSEKYRASLSQDLLEIFYKILLCWIVHCTISTAVEQRFPILGFILVHRFTGSARNSWRYSIRYYWIVQPEQLREGDKNVYCPINSTTGQYCRCGNMKSTYSISWLELSGFRTRTTTAVINSVKIGTSASQVGIPNVFTEIRNTNFFDMVNSTTGQCRRGNMEPA